MSIAQAATNNKQIYMIGEDHDINHFLITILSGHEAACDDILRSSLASAFLEIEFDESTGRMTKRVHKRSHLTLPEEHGMISRYIDHPCFER